MTDLPSQIAKARELCGCTRCQGGYEIGARTIAKSEAAPLRPSSCLADTILKELLDSQYRGAEDITKPRCDETIEDDQCIFDEHTVGPHDNGLGRMWETGELP